MGKFCSNCGAEISGKFCSNCGSPIGEESVANTDKEITSQEMLNGVTFNAVALFAENRGAVGRMKIINKLGKLTGAPLKMVVAFVDTHLQDKVFMNKVFAYEGIPGGTLPPMRCPSCSSTNIQIEKNGFGFGKSFVGGFLLGPLGLLAGGIGAKGVKCICLNCGNRFSPKKAR